MAGCLQSNAAAAKAEGMRVEQVSKADLARQQAEDAAER